MERSRIPLIVAILIVYINLAAAYTLNVDNIYKGEYSYNYDTDAITENREGKLDENGDQVVKGSYTIFIDDNQYTVTYYADKNGYHPTITISKIPKPETVSFALPSRAVASILG